MFRFSPKYFVLLLLVGLLPLALKAQDSLGVRYDSSQLEVRQPAPGSMEKYLADEDFDYSREVPPPPESLWQRIWRWIGKQINRLFSDHPVAIVIRYLILIFFVLFLLIKIFQIRLGGFFYRSQKNKAPDVFAENENIHEIDLEEIISQHIAKGEYRKAVRYLYLKALKILDTAELINWKIEKTNHDYQRELQKQPFRQEFAALSALYEYVWYGNFLPERANFEQIQSDFRLFYKKIEPKTQKALAS